MRRYLTNCPSSNLAAFVDEELRVSLQAVRVGMQGEKVSGKR